MENISKIRIPLSQSEDFNPDKSTWFDGKLTRVNEGPTTTLYLFHSQSTEVIYLEQEGEQPYEIQVMEAFPVRVQNPVSRDEAINNAEMQRYGLYTAMQVASFNASLARKARSNERDAEVIEHDEFIQQVKDELTAIGVI